jgi:hypothetical protein
LYVDQGTSKVSSIFDYIFLTLSVYIVTQDINSKIVLFTFIKIFFLVVFSLLQVWLILSIISGGKIVNKISFNRTSSEELKGFTSNEVIL